MKVVYPQSLSLEVGTFNEVAPALNSLLELTNGGENYTIKAIFQWKLHREIFIVTITIPIFHPDTKTKAIVISHQFYKLRDKYTMQIMVESYLVDKVIPIEYYRYVDIATVIQLYTERMKVRDEIFVSSDQLNSIVGAKFFHQ